MANIIQEILTTKSSYYPDSLVEKYNPNAFMQSKGFTTIDKMLADEQIFSVLELKKSLILSTGFTISYNDNDSINEDIVGLLERNLQDEYDGLFTADLSQILSAYEYGFSVSEKIFKRVDNIIMLSKLKTVPPHSIEFETDALGNISNILQKQDYKEMKIPKEKIVLYVHNSRFGLPYGNSDLRRCYEVWFAKTVYMRLWSIYLQKFASPFPVAKVPDNFGSDLTASLLQKLASIQQATALVLPNSADLELHKAGNGSGGEYNEAIEKMNQLIGRALLLPDLLGFGQTTGGGSYSLGKKQFELFMNVIRSQQLFLEEVINEQVIKQIVDINFGNQKQYPRLKFNDFSNEGDLDKIKIFLDAIKNNMPADLATWNEVRTKLGFNGMSEEEMQEAILKQDKKPEPQEPTTKNNDNERDDELSKEEDELAKNQQSFTEWKFADRFDHIAISKVLNDMELKLITRLSDLLKETNADLKDTVQSKKILSRIDFDGARKLQMFNKGALKRALQAGLQDVYQMSFAQAKNEIKYLIHVRKFEMNDLMISLEKATALANEMINNVSFNAVGKLEADIMAKARQLIISGIQQGKGELWAVEKLNDLFATITQNPLVNNPQLLQVIVRNFSTNVFNQARRDVATDPDLKGFIKAFEYSAIMDNRTSAICQDLDGKIYPVESTIWQSITPPNHHNCRSTIMYVTEQDIAIDGIKMSDGMNLDKLKEASGGFIL